MIGCLFVEKLATLAYIVLFVAGDRREGERLRVEVQEDRCLQNQVFEIVE